MLKEMGVDTAGSADPTDHRDIPDHMALKKLERKEGKFKIMVLVFPSHHYTQWSPAFAESCSWEVGN